MGHDSPGRQLIRIQRDSHARVTNQPHCWHTISTPMYLLTPKEQQLRSGDQLARKDYY